MRALFLAAGAALALSACGDGGNSEANDMNATADSMMMDQNASMNMDANMDMNMDMNAVDPATQNMIAKDMNTNAPDTNLANGM